MKRHSRAGYGPFVLLRIIWLLAGASVLVAFQAPAPNPADSSYDVVLFAKDVMVPMRDGVRLATDVYRRAHNGEPVEDKLPILLQRTPYNKEGPGLVESARYFVRQGYVVALQVQERTSDPDRVRIDEERKAVVVGGRGSNALPAMRAA